MFSKLKFSWRNQQLNRELVGSDMYGNSYYQHYDDTDLPTKREVEYKEGMHNPIMDPIWAGWLNGSETMPPSRKEIEESYEQYLKRSKIGQDWDAQDEVMMRQFREVMKQANPKQRRPSEEFTPDAWGGDKGSKKY